MVKWMDHTGAAGEGRHGWMVRWSDGLPRTPVTDAATHARFGLNPEARAHQLCCPDRKFRVVALLRSEPDSRSALRIGLIAIEAKHKEANG